MLSLIRKGGKYDIFHDSETQSKIVRFYNEDKTLAVDIDGVTFAHIMVDNATPDAVAKWLERRGYAVQNPE